MVGIDSFEGLPKSSTIWEKGLFSDTSFELVEKKLKSQIKHFSKVELIKGWFNDPFVAKSLYEKVNNIAIVHFDSDLASSTLEALKVLDPYLRNRKQPMFLLFDDWGCHPDEVPYAFNKWLTKAKLKYKFKERLISSTKITRYFELKFNK